MSAAKELQRIAAHESTLILAGLTPIEQQRFHEAGVGYSGATGTPDAVLGQYIATFGREASQAFAALGWRHVHIEINGNSWIARKARRRKDK